MKAWFFGLQPRERWLVTICAAVFVVVVGIFTLRNVRADLADLRTSVDTKQRILVDIARIESEQPTTVTSNRQGSNQTLNGIVDETARNHGLGSPRTRANGGSGVDVTIQGVSFDALTAWLITLHNTYGVDVETVSISSAREPGLVNGQISLRRL
jgi:type II secretory pathway component PulM